MSIYQPPERQRERERESEADGGRESRHRLEERREGTSVNGRTLAFKSDHQGSPLTPLGPPRLSGMLFSRFLRGFSGHAGVGSNATSAEGPLSGDCLL